MKRLRLAIISSALPKPCGIATFNRDFITALRSAGTVSVSVIAVHERLKRDRKYPRLVSQVIRGDVAADYDQAAEWINRQGFDAVVIQHEHGLYGSGDGQHVFRLLESLTIPTLTILHTVGLTPQARRRKTRLRQLHRLVEHSDLTAVPGQLIKQYLVEQEHLPARKLVAVLHGSPQFPKPTDRRKQEAQKKLGLAGKTVLLTPGLIRKSKGIEQVLDAMPGLCEDHPDLVYLVAGDVNPRSKDKVYYQKLQRLSERQGIADRVRFENRFHTETAWRTLFMAADIVVLPYTRMEQASSGVLAQAVAAGRPIVSTPFWYARELLEPGRGLFAEPSAESVGSSLRSVLDDRPLRRRLEQQAWRYGIRTAWPAVGQQYLRAIRRLTG